MAQKSEGLWASSYLSQQQIADACEVFTYAPAKVDCFVKLSPLHIPSGVGPVCAQFTYPPAQRDCLASFDGTNPTPQQLQICSSFTYAPAEVDCLHKLIH